jgi:hypothetical protein
MKLRPFPLGRVASVVNSPGYRSHEKAAVKTAAS